MAQAMLLKPHMGAWGTPCGQAGQGRAGQGRHEKGGVHRSGFHSWHRLPAPQVQQITEGTSSHPAHICPQTKLLSARVPSCR